MKDIFGNELSLSEARNLLRCKSTPKKGYAASPGTGPNGEKCKTCKNLYRKTMSKTYVKCLANEKNWTGGQGSDIKVNSPACRLWEKNK